MFLIYIFIRFELSPLIQGNAENLQTRCDVVVDIGETSNNTTSQPVANKSQDDANVSRTAIAMIEFDKWEIHPINIFAGKPIGDGFGGTVYRSRVKSSSICKLKSIISDSLKHKHVFAAVKIFKGLLTIIILSLVFKCPF